MKTRNFLCPNAGNAIIEAETEVRYPAPDFPEVKGHEIRRPGHSEPPGRKRTRLDRSGPLGRKQTAWMEAERRDGRPPGTEADRPAQEKIWTNSIIPIEILGIYYIIDL